MADDDSGRALEWARVVVVPITAAIISAAVVAITSIVSTDQTVKVAYVQLATDALSRELPSVDATDEARNADKALREWAVDVLAGSSPVALSDAAQQHLKLGEVTLVAPDLTSRLGVTANGTSLLMQLLRQARAVQQCEDEEPGSTIEIEEDVENLGRVVFSYLCEDGDRDGKPDAATPVQRGESTGG